MKNQIFISNIFQSKALKEIDKAVLENEKAFLVVMPTGTGKTYLAAQWFMLQLKKNPKARLLYVCHNQDILSQANDKEFANCLSEFDIPRGYYNKSEKNIGQVTFATVQTLRRNLDKLPPDYFDYIIVDEAHHYKAKSFEIAIKHFSPKVLLGLTATPNRMDGKSILDVFGKTVYSESIASGIKNGLLSKIKYYYVENDIDFSEIQHDSHGNYDKKDLNKKLCIKEYDDAIIKEYTETVKQEHNRKKTICFCATVEHAYRMEKLFNDNGIKATALTGKRLSETGKEVTVHDGRRRQIISMFKDGDYDIIFVRDLFNEGMDIPDADCIMMLRPTESSRIFTQQIGRGLRKWEGKDYLLALDFTGNCYKCDINYELLNDIFDVDIEKYVKDQIRNSNPSEIVIQNLGCEVILSKKKIYVIKGSEDKTEEKIITKEMLTKNYLDVKNKLGKRPSAADLDIIKNNGSLYELNDYRRIFGSWKDFLISIGAKRVVRNYVPTEKELIDNYFEVKKKLGRQPREKDINESGISVFKYRKYIKYFGSWSKFLHKIDEKSLTHDFVSENDLIENYLEVKKELNKVPTYQEMNKYGKFHIATFSKRFGTWYKFLVKMGERKYDDVNIISDEELIKNYWDLKNRYHNLTKDMVTRKNGSRYDKETYCNRFESWNKFLESIGEKVRNKKDIRISDEELIKNYFNVKKELNKVPTHREMYRYGKFAGSTYNKRFENWNKFLESIGEKPNIYEKRKKNITIISDYTPKNPLPDLNFEKSNKRSRIDIRTLLGHKYTGSNNKDNIRYKIIEKIQDGDTVLMLESPKLDALKEIEKQGKNPKKIIIPNHFEFDDIAAALKKYNTNLNIEVINTSALQYLTDHPGEYFNFLWLDYCGAFSYYIRDLDIMFQREIRDMKLILTYNAFDPKKQDDSYYFTNVISYVLKKLRGKNEILLMEDVSQRYKKTMFSVGFDIKKSNVTLNSLL